MTQIPSRFTHDCTRCRYLGQHGAYDLYVCTHVVHYGSIVLARYGNAGHEYASGPVDIQRSIVSDVPATLALQEAIRRLEQE